jgi:hypothetical protein
MEQQDKISSECLKTALSREELEKDLRARAWKDDAFRQKFLANPKAVLERDYAQSFPEGQIPSEISIKVIEEDEQTLCFVLPPTLSGDQISELEHIDDEELLDTLAGGGRSLPNRSCFVTYCCTDSPSCLKLQKLGRLPL